MRLRRTIVGAAVVLALLAAVGCSRLTFVKPKYKNDFHSTAPDYQVRNDPKDAQRIVAIDEVAMAEQSLRAGKLDDTDTHAKAALKADPGSADAYTLLAIVQDQRGSATQAGQLYAKAAALAPARGVTLNNYGAWLCSNGRAAESLPLFERAASDPGYATPAAAVANAGSCALQLGQDALAARYLAQALQWDPNNPVALEGMAESRFRAGQYLEARAFSERRLSVATASVKVLQLASQIEQKMGDTAAAARYVQRIATEFPQQRAVPTGDASQ
jgi:type IV pilus assembly protein PilF